MSDSADEIRRQMRDIRRDVGADVDGIVDSAHELSDWRYYVKRYPWLCVGSAFAVGLLAAPRRRELLKQVKQVQPSKRFDIKKLAAAWSPGRSAVPTAAVSAPGGGLAMKLITVLGPIAARSAASFIAHRLGGGATPADGGDRSSFEHASKPR